MTATLEVQSQEPPPNLVAMPACVREFVMLMSRLLNHRRLMMLGVVVTSQVMTVFLLVVPTR